MSNMVIDRQTVSLTNIKAIVVSDIVHDEINSVYVRTLKFYDTALTTLNAKPILELIISGIDAASVEIITPSLHF